MAARLKRATLLAALAAAGCGERAPRVALPPFAARLPGHTIAVSWGAAPELPAPDGWLDGVGVRLQEEGGVRALVGEPGSVGWSSLADNALFAEAVAEAPVGDWQAFVDLQQVVAAATRALSAPGRGGGLPRALAGHAAQRAIDAFRLRGLAWIAAGVRDAEGEVRVEAVVAGADEGLFGALGTGAPLPLPATWPDRAADARVLVRFAPTAVVRIVRELVGGEEGGAFDVMREALRGPRFDAALAALGGLGGSAAAVLAGGDVWLWASLRAPDAVADALDVIASPAQDGWALGGFTLRIADGALTATTGAGWTGPSRPVPATGAALSVELPRAGQSWAVERAGAGRLRLHGATRR